jgi:divalent metal cation (Fe/Co/Zn/Cd) transporter
MVGAKIAVAEKATGKQIAKIIDSAEENMRIAVPSARVIYLEPDIERNKK